MCIPIYAYLCKLYFVSDTYDSSYMCVYISVLMQLTLEQQGLEMRGPTYMQSSSNTQCYSPAQSEADFFGFVCFLTVPMVHMSRDQICTIAATQDTAVTMLNP